MMLKQGVSPEELRIYDLYLQRIMKEYDLIWSRFKIYFGFNSGVFVVIGFLVNPYLNIPFSDIPDILLGGLILISIIGIIFSIAWLFVNRDGKKWMLLMNDIIAKVEDSIFEEKDCALYKKIVATYTSGPKWKSDVIDINLYVSSAFLIIFILLTILFLMIAYK